MLPAWRCIRCGLVSVARDPGRCACGCAAFDVIRVRRAELEPRDTGESDGQFTSDEIRKAHADGKIEGVLLSLVSLVILAVLCCGAAIVFGG